MLDAPPLGLGREPRVGGHYFRALGFMTLRLEGASVQKRLEGLLVAACHHGSALTANVEVAVPYQVSGMPLYALQDAEPEKSAVSDVVAGRLIASISSDAAPVCLYADDLSLSLGDSAWVPASTALREPLQLGFALEVETNLASSVHAIAGIWDSDRGNAACRQLLTARRAPYAWRRDWRSKADIRRRAG